MQTQTGSTVISRRQVLVHATLIAAGGILTACGGNETPLATPSPGATTAGGSAAARATPGVAGTTQPKGTLRLAIGVNFPATIDATKNGFSLISYGAAETLTRLTPQGTLEPWLAESVTNVDASTWRVTLRKGAHFWDGSPVMAEDVAAAFKKNWETQPAADGLISKETLVTVVDPTTLDFKAPKPTGNFPNALSAPFFVVHKGNGLVMTGPYRITSFEVDRGMALAAFTDHWSGTPPIARIDIKYVADTNARVLALQAGDVDMLWQLPPDVVKTLGADYEITAQPSSRMHFIKLNHDRPLFGDRAVREATALAIDRAALLKAVMEGQGAAATGIFPMNAGVDSVPIQSTDVNRARQLLDDAGWKAGADGTRAKDGKRLAFTLYSFPQRGEMTPMAVAIQSQLKPLGFDMQVQQVQDIGSQVGGGNFDAGMASIDTLVTGDPLYLFNSTLVKGARSNEGRYTNPRVEELVNQLRVEVDPAKRQAISRQAQAILKEDVPNIYLVVPPIITAAQKGKVKGFTPYPYDQYFVNTSLSMA